MSNYNYTSYNGWFIAKLSEYKQYIDDKFLVYKKSGTEEDLLELKKTILDVYCKIGYSSTDSASNSSVKNEYFSNMSEALMEDIQRLEYFAEKYDTNKGSSFIVFFSSSVSRKFEKLCAEENSNNENTGMKYEISENKRKLPERLKEILTENNVGKNVSDLSFKELQHYCELLRLKYPNSDYKTLNAQKLYEVINMLTKTSSIYAENNEGDEILICDMLKNNRKASIEDMVIGNYEAFDMSLVNEILSDDSSITYKKKRCIKARIMLDYIKKACKDNTSDDYNMIISDEKYTFIDTIVYDEEIFMAIKYYYKDNKKFPTQGMLTQIIGVSKNSITEADNVFDKMVEEKVYERRKEF